MTSAYGRDSSPTTLAIETTGLTRRFGKNTVVDRVDLAIPQGDVYGLLGPNGAGKTTVIRMLATLLPITSGTAHVLGSDVGSEPALVRSKIAVTGQYASLDEDLTATENLVLLGRLYGLRGTEAKARSVELLEAFGLADASRRQVKKFSGGMRRRLDIAGSMVVTPELLFLDEPTTGLDPRSRNQVWDIIRSFVAAGTTVVLTTQYLEEADQLADRIAVIDHGRLIAEGTASQLKSSVGSTTAQVRLADPGDRQEAGRLVESMVGSPVYPDRDPTALRATVARAEAAEAILPALRRAGIGVSSFSIGQPSLDEVFLAITGTPARETESEET